MNSKQLDILMYAILGICLLLVIIGFIHIAITTPIVIVFFIGIIAVAWAIARFMVK